MGTIKSGFDPCGIIRAGLISIAAGRTILAKTIMVAGVLTIISLITMPAIIGPINERRNGC